MADKSKNKARCKGCNSEEEAEEAIEAEEKIEKLMEEKDTGQHPVSREGYKEVKPSDCEDWEEDDAQ